jgi:transposase
MRAKRGLLERALAGRMAAHQRFLLTEQLCHIDALDESIGRLSAEIAERMRPSGDALERLDTIPGIGPRMAEILVAEIGVDMSRFPSAAHLASWAGMCPATRRVRASARAARRARAASGYAGHSSSQCTRWAEAAVSTWRLSIVDSPRGVARRRRPWLEFAALSGAGSVCRHAQLSALPTVRRHA